MAANDLELPEAVASIVARIATARGTVAVALGGSRARGEADAGSDWDLGLYYRGALDLAPLAELGEVHPPGAWGRLMNGGAWLRIGDVKIDVLLRDLDVVERWTEAAGRGAYEVDGLLGYLAGLPTYSLAAELAAARVLRGALPPPPTFPEALARTAPPRWRFHAAFSLEHARMRAARGDAVGAWGQCARAAVEAAHARLCAAHRWQLNEKRILEAAGLGHLQALFTTASPAGGLVPWVESAAAAIEAACDAASPAP